jgi:hypothetical protein
MFTTQGGRAVIRSFADSPLVTHMAFGIGATAATVSDTRLECEILRIPISTITPDFVGGTIVYKATIPAEEAIDVFELGLVNNPLKTSTLISDFAEVSTWSAGTTSTSNSRYGAGTLFLNPALSATTTATGAFSFVWTDADEVIVSYFVGTNVASASIRLGTDTSNYYSFSLPVTAGYRISRIPRSSFTTTGAPGAINTVSVIATATAGGAGSVYFDTLSINDTADRDPDLQVRRVLASDVNKASGIARDMEYVVTVTAT